MRALISLAVVTALGACSEVAGVTANAALKGHQTGNAEDAERAIARRFAADPALASLRVSVAYGNHWRDGFQARASVLMAGTAPDEAARSRAAEIIREIVGGTPDGIAILDRSRIGAR